MPIVSFNIGSPLTSGLMALAPATVQSTPIVEPFTFAFSWGGLFSNLYPSDWDGNIDLGAPMLPMPVSFPADFTTSPQPRCYVPPLTNVYLTFQWIRSGVAYPIGTLTMPANQTLGSYSTNGIAYTVPAGDIVRLIMPPMVSSPMIGLSGVIIGEWVTS